MYESALPTPVPLTLPTHPRPAGARPSGIVATASEVALAPAYLCDTAGQSYHIFGCHSDHHRGAIQSWARPTPSVPLALFVRCGLVVLAHLRLAAPSPSCDASIRERKPRQLAHGLVLLPRVVVNRTAVEGLEQVAFCAHIVEVAAAAAVAVVADGCNELAQHTSPLALACRSTRNAPARRIGNKMPYVEHTTTLSRSDGSLRARMTKRELRSLAQSQTERNRGNRQTRVRFISREVPRAPCKLCISHSSPPPHGCPRRVPRLLPRRHQRRISAKLCLQLRGSILLSTTASRSPEAGAPAELARRTRLCLCFYLEWTAHL